MSVKPRIIFTRFVSWSSPKLQSWRDHVRDVAGADNAHVVAPTARRADGAVVWQLVSANNRPLARSAGIFETFADATRAASAAVSVTASLTDVLVSEPRTGMYGWYLKANGEAVLTCSRYYSTERDRQQSIALATLTLASAVLLDGARLSDPGLMLESRPLR